MSKVLPYATIPLNLLKGITGAQLDPGAGITGSQLAAAAGLVIGQFSSGAATVGQVATADGAGLLNWKDQNPNPLYVVDGNAASATAGGSNNRLETYHRAFGGTSLTFSSGQIVFVYFTAKETFTVSTINADQGGTLGSGLTTSRMGLYSANATGDVTFLARTATTTNTYFTHANALATNSTTGAQLCDASNVATTVAFAAGSRYAAALLIVVSTTMPSVKGYTTGVGMEALYPVGARIMNTQTELPTGTTLASAMNGATNNVPWFTFA